MAATAEVLQHVKPEVEFNLPRSLQLAAREHGKGAGAQVRDIWRLRFGPGKLRPDEYYYYRSVRRPALHVRRQAQVPRPGARRIGSIRRATPTEWWFVAHDKLVFYAMLAGQGLPVPQTRAIYHRSRRCAAAVRLAEPAALAAWLRAGID